MSGTIKTQLTDGGGWIEISNPARRNALSVGMMAQLDEALRRLDADPAVRAIVLRGDGDSAFSAGADISEFHQQQNSDEARALADKTVARLFDTLSDVDTPVLAMIHGHCLGGGVAVALGADLRLAADSARFAIPAARLGIGYPVALTHALARIVGPARAADILFTGRIVEAAEAYASGLVNQVVPDSELEDLMRKVVATIVANAPLSVRAAKAAIRAMADPDRRANAENAVAACAGSNDAREGARAFMRKRSPRFTGQ